MMRPRIARAGAGRGFPAALLGALLVIALAAVASGDELPNLDPGAERRLATLDAALKTSRLSHDFSQLKREIEKLFAAQNQDTKLLGLRWVHYRRGSLTEEEVDQLLNSFEKSNANNSLVRYAREMRASGQTRAREQSTAPDLSILVLDNECRPLPGMAVTLVPTGETADRALRMLATNANGEAQFFGIAEGKYDILVTGDNFISNRLGPLTVRKGRALRPTVVLNLSFDWVSSSWSEPK